MGLDHNAALGAAEDAEFWIRMNRDATAPEVDAEMRDLGAALGPILFLMGEFNGDFVTNNGSIRL